MKKITLLILLSACCILRAHAQDAKLWTEADRKYLLENLIRTRDELVKETDKLTEKQWKFKESPERRSINGVIEHLAIWELIFERQISQSLSGKPQPELNRNAKPDSTYFNFIEETKPHFSSDYTKPFTWAEPMGLNDLKNNMAWLLKMRNESIAYISTTQDDLRAYYLTPDRPNVHQVYINVFGHFDRALRQIKKIKQHANYPK